MANLCKTLIALKQFHLLIDGLTHPQILIEKLPRYKRYCKNLLWLTKSRLAPVYCIPSYLSLGWRTSEGVPSDWFEVCSLRGEVFLNLVASSWMSLKSFGRLPHLWLCSPLCTGRENERERERYCRLFDASSWCSYCISFFTFVWIAPITFSFCFKCTDAAIHIIIIWVK